MRKQIFFNIYDNYYLALQYQNNMNFELYAYMDGLEFALYWIIINYNHFRNIKHHIKIGRKAGPVLP